MDGSPGNLNLRKTATGLMLAVRLTPKSSRVTVLKARVRALPEDGRANAALEKLIAKWLGVPPSSVEVAQGGKSRVKQVAIHGNGIGLSALICSRLAELNLPSS